MREFIIEGGYNYTGPITVLADSIEEAAWEWYDRYSSNGLRSVDGSLWPCFGDMEDDSYAVVDPRTEDTMTRAEVLDLAA